VTAPVILGKSLCFPPKFSNNREKGQDEAFIKTLEQCILTSDPAACKSYLSSNSFVSWASTSSGTERFTAHVQFHQVKDIFLVADI
jgi:hypothetical protein